MKVISVVTPIYNEEKLVEELMARLQKVTQGLAYQFEFVLVDDGSQDNSLNKLLSIQSHEPRLKIVKLSRNWGFQNAYNAGLDRASGDAIVLMDGDLEDPPEMIVDFLKKWEEGFDVVYAVKASREDGKLKKIMLSLFYFLMDRFSDVPMEKQAGMFSLIDRKVADELKKFREKNKYFVGLRFLVGFKQAQLLYNRQKRYAGAPKQTFRRLIRYALNALFSFSYFPIRFLTYTGLFIFLTIIPFSLIMAVVRIFGLKFWILGGLPGWTSIVLLLFFILGVQITFMGILGEYIRRIYDEVRNRPYYIVENVFTSNEIQERQTA